MSFLDFLPTGQTRAVSPKTAGQVRSWNPLRVSGAVGALDRKQAQTMSPVQFSSVAQSCPTLCDPMDCSMPGLPVHHQLPEFTQTHVHQVIDAIQPSHPLLFPSPPTCSLSRRTKEFPLLTSVPPSQLQSRLGAAEAHMGCGGFV